MSSSYSWNGQGGAGGAGGQPGQPGQPGGSGGGRGGAGGAGGQPGRGGQSGGRGGDGGQSVVIPGNQSSGFTMPQFSFTSKMDKLQVRVFGNGRLPTRADPDAAGYDLYSGEAITIAPWTTAKVLTNISITVPVGTYGRIAERSGLASKTIFVGGGVVDRSYTGDVGVLLFNGNDTPFQVSIGDRIAQLILEQHKIAEILLVENLEPTSRGDNGFGSSGK